MKNFAFSLACGLGATAPSAAGLSVNFSFTQESYSPGETTYHLFVTPSSPNIQLIGIGGYSSSLFTFSSSADLIHQEGEPGDSFLGWGESDTGFTPGFPAFEGSSVETFEGFYYDSSLHTPILGVSQFAQITLPTEAEFSLAGIARYLIAGQKIDFNFEFNSVPAPSALAPLLCLGFRGRRRKCQA